MGPIDYAKDSGPNPKNRQIQLKTFKYGSDMIRFGLLSKKKGQRRTRNNVERPSGTSFNSLWISKVRACTRMVEVETEKSGWIQILLSRYIQQLLVLTGCGGTGKEGVKNDSGL